MFLFIFESIGTSELLLIGVVALIFLGPRRMPEMARKIGKIMAEFRGTANEFKDTWRREVDFEEEAKAFNINNLESEPIPRIAPREEPPAASAPEVKEVDPERLELLRAQAAGSQASSATADLPVQADDPNDKRNWL